MDEMTVDFNERRVAVSDRRGGGDRRKFNYTAHAPERRIDTRRTTIRR